MTGEDCLDVGASTGGFTDCLLQAGAARVVALDVGYGQLDSRLRADPRVTVLERANVRHLDCADLPFAPSFVVCDVSFIGLDKALPPALACAAPGWRAVALVKPQFEAGRPTSARAASCATPRCASAFWARWSQRVPAWGGRVVGRAIGPPGPEGQS